MKNSNKSLLQAISFISIIVCGILLNSLSKAESLEHQLPADLKINLETNDEALYKSKSNQLNHFAFRLVNNGSINLTKYQIINDGKIFLVSFKNDAYYVDGYPNFKKDTFIENPLTSELMPLPIIINNPKQLGKVSFNFNSAQLTPRAKITLDLLAVEIFKTGLDGIYLVGNADNTGTDSANLKITKNRVLKVKNYLVSVFKTLNYDNVKISSENMSSIFAAGNRGVKNEADRNVTFLVYPNI